jgi:carbon monoxide dehydrogenase subunit G
MTVHVEAKTLVNAPASVVWDILDDFENIADHTDQVKTSTLASDNATGVGAIRQCDLAPFGSTNEKILEYAPQEKMVIELYDLSGIPIKGSRSTFALKPMSENQTELTFSSEVEPKGGIAKGFLSKRLESRLPKGAKEMVDDLAHAAEERLTRT